MFCVKCGTQSLPNMKFCIKCGANLVAATPNAQETAAESTVSMAEPTVVTTQENEWKRPVEEAQPPIAEEQIAEPAQAAEPEPLQAVELEPQKAIEPEARQVVEPEPKQAVSLEPKQTIVQPAVEPPTVVKPYAKLPRAITAVLSIGIIAAMLMGWVTLRVDIGSMLDSFISNVGMPTIAEGYQVSDTGQEVLQRIIDDVFTEDLNQTYTMFGLVNFAAMLDLLVDVVEAEASNLGMTPRDVRDLREQMELLEYIPTVANIAMIVIYAIALILLVFVFIMLVEAKAARVIGIIGTVCTTTISGVFSIVMLVGSRLLPREIGRYISISASPWVYAALGLSAIALIMLIIFGNSINCKGKVK